MRLQKPAGNAGLTLAFHARDGLLDDARQTVLSDPNYERRRQQEEHKLNQARSRR